MKRLIALALVVLLGLTTVQAQQSVGPVGPTGGTTFLGGEITAPLLGADGSASAPTYSFTNAPDVGIYYAGANILGLKGTGPTTPVLISATGLVLTSGDLYLADAGVDLILGAASDVGLTRSAAGVVKVTNGSSGDGSLYAGGNVTAGVNLVVATGGADALFSRDTWDAASGMRLAWSSTSNAQGSKDTGLARAAAGVLRVTDGSTGRGQLSLSASTGFGQRVVSGNKALVAASPTAVLQVDLPAGTMAGVFVNYTVYSNDAVPDYNARSGRVQFQMVNDGGTEACTVVSTGDQETEDGSAIAGSSTLTYTWTAVTTGANECELALNAASGLTETVLAITYTATLNANDVSVTLTPQ